MAPRKRHSTRRDPGHSARTGASQAARRREAHAKKDEVTRGGRQVQDHTMDNLNSVDVEGSGYDQMSNANDNANDSVVASTPGTGPAVSSGTAGNGPGVRSANVRDKKKPVAVKKPTNSIGVKRANEQAVLKRMFSGNKKLQAVLAGTWRRKAVNPSPYKRTTGNGDVFHLKWSDGFDG